MKQVGAAVLFFLLRGFVFCLPYSLLMHLGRGLGRLLYCLLPRRVHIADVNLQLCFPELSHADRVMLVKKSFASMGMGVMEAALAWYAPESFFSDRIEVKGQEIIEAHLARGESVILLSYHTTCLELAAQAIAYYVPNYLVAYKQRNVAIAKKLTRHRERFVKQVINSDDLKGMLRVLKKGGVTMTYAFDHDLGRERSVFVKFFAEEAATIKATSRLAKGAKVMPVSFYRGVDGCYTLEFFPVLADFPSNDVLQDTWRLNKTIEPLISAHLDQYIWTHRRFKNRPAGYPY